MNTGKSVFKDGAKYYALDQGVWYEADSPNGPWKVSTTPPKQVDKIPASNPHYNAKYVKVYDSTADTVTTGYTPGYTGSYVDNGSVVYGTGYDYPAYSTADTYIPPAAPPTYGYAAAYDPYESSWGYQSSSYNPSSWLGPGLVGAGLGLAGGYAIWGNHNNYGGGYWGPGGYNNVNIDNSHNNVINPKPGQRPPGWQPGTNLEDVLGGLPPCRPTRRTCITGRETRPSWPPGPANPLPCRSAALFPVALVQGAGERPGTQPARPGQAAGPKAEARPAQAAKPAQPKVKPAGGPNNVLADKNGNVYKRDNQGNMKSAAKPATRPAAASRPTPRPSVDSKQLNRDYAARQRGEVRTQNFARASAPRPSVSRPSGGRR